MKLLLLKLVNFYYIKFGLLMILFNKIKIVP
jgi:hypothetical protein